MAVTQNLDSRLQLTFEDRVDSITGKSIYKNKSFNNVKTSATADALFAITDVLVPLQTKPLYTIKRNNSILITED